MFDNMEMRREQSADVVKELEQMKNLTCPLLTSEPMDR